jgi:hypothetical protein
VIPNLETIDQLQDYWSVPERVFLIVERGRLDEARSVIGQMAPLEARAIGSNFAYLFANRGPPVPPTRAEPATEGR